MISYWAQVFLPSTFNVARLDVTLLFTSLEATHWYSPLSSISTPVILSFFLSPKKLILLLSAKVVPSLNHEKFGSGTPCASLEKFTGDPFVTV